MALKSYEELVKVDVRQYCEERDGFTYLNWAKCIELLRQNGATEVYWEPIPDPQTGSSLRKTDIEFKDKNNNTNRCYETRIKVVIDDKEYEMQTPVMNGANPVKDNSMSQQRVWNSMCRAFVKCVAIHTGLGFNLWLKEEYNKLEAKIPGTGENLASEAKKKTLKTQCTAHGMCLIRYGYPVILSGKSACATIPDTEEAENKVKNSTEYHLQPTSQVREGVDGVMYRTYRLLRGSRTYNTEEMSRLISGLITMCKEAQIPDREIATPEEKRLLKERYGVDV